MKKLLNFVAVVLIACMCFGVACVDVPDSQSEEPQNKLEFINDSGEVEVGKQITIPYKYIVNGVNGDGSKLVWTSSDETVATVSAGKATGVSQGTAVITASAGELNARFSITVKNPAQSEKTIEEIIADLMSDGYMDTSYSEEGENPRYSEEWEKLLLKKQPLSEGEKYVEDFEVDYVTSRLFPEAFVNGAKVEYKSGADGIDPDGKSLSIKTNGEENGNYDAVVFKGFEITPGARYRISLKAKTINDGRNYYVGFRSSADDVYAFNFSGAAGEEQTVSGTVTLAEKAYVGLVIMIAGGDAAELIIDDLTVERLAELPEIDLTAAGSSVTLDFDEGIDYVSANNSSISHVTGEEAISGGSLKVVKTGSWQGADFTDIKFAAKGIYRVSFDVKLLSGSAGMAFATFSSAANGSYQDIGKQLTVINTVTSFKEVYELKDFSDYYLNFSFSDASCSFVVDNLKIERLTEEDLNKIDLTAMGAKYEENFEVSAVEDLKHFSAASSVLSLEEANGGKALKITKTGAWAGLNTKDLVLQASATYRVIFKIKLVSGNTDNMFATCSSAGNGSYQDVGQAITPTYEWKKLTLDYTLKDFGDYYFNFSFYDPSAVVLIDDFSIERIDPDNRPAIEPDEPETPAVADLTAPGAKYEENFDDITAENLAKHYVDSGNAADITVENGALKVKKKGQWQGLKFIGFNLKNGSTYKFTFDLAVESMGSTDFFELLFADGTAEKVSHGLASYVKIGESVKVSFEVTLKADATEFLMGCWSGDAIYTLDNLVIENVTK